MPNANRPSRQSQPIQSTRSRASIRGRSMRVGRRFNGKEQCEGAGSGHKSEGLVLLTSWSRYRFPSYLPQSILLLKAAKTIDEALLSCIPEAPSLTVLLSDVVFPGPLITLLTAEQF